jgi:hypothetical protein
MAHHAGVSPSTVQRIWANNDLKPHITKTFKLSNVMAPRATTQRSFESHLSRRWAGAAAGEQEPRYTASCIPVFHIA